MIAAQRRYKIKEMLMRDFGVKVGDLVQLFQVSEETIRRDLSQLEREGFVKKNYGGAVLVEDVSSVASFPPPVQQRRFELFEEKDAIGRAAASLVRDDQVVILDSGSTTWCVARHLRDKRNLTVVTNGLQVAEELSQNQDSSIVVIGGKLNTNTMSLVCTQPKTEILRYSSDIVFLGTTGISPRKGFTSSDMYEAEMKQAIVDVGKKRVIVADHTKLTKQGLISFASFDDIDMLVTSSLAKPEDIREIEKSGVEVLVCDVQESAASVSL